MKNLKSHQIVVADDACDSNGKELSKRFLKPSFSNLDFECCIAFDTSELLRVRIPYEAPHRYAAVERHQKSPLDPILQSRGKESGHLPQRLPQLFYGPR